MHPSSINNPFVTMMVIIIAILALIIFMMARLVIGSAGLYYEKWKEEEKEENKTNAAKIVTTLALLLLSIHVFAQDGTTTTSINNGALSQTAWYMLSGVIGVELLIVAVLLYMLRVFTAIKKKSKVVAVTEVATIPAITWWDRFNKLKPINEEADIQLDHNYDGIKELDNRLPPWWLYGFYFTIVFAFVYLYMHEVSHSAPSGVEEYQIAVAKAAVEKEAYLKKAANNVDETTVKLLTAETDLAAGKQVFQSTCFACHGKQGEGSVGPNLTDDYWLHGGSIADVFKTIKYGWADKGMKSWKDDLSPVQIAQVASYIKSLHGTNPPNAKTPQGVLAK